MIRRILAIIGNLFYKNRTIELYTKAYESIAPYYDQCATRQVLAEETKKLIESLALKPGMHCLDLGCGTGHGTALIDEKVSPGGTVIGCDVSKPMLDVAKKNISRLYATTFIEKDMLTALSEQKDSSLDIVTSFWALDYNSEIVKTLKEVKRVLTENGRVAMLVNTQESLPELQRIVTKVFLKNLFVLRRIPPVCVPANLRKFYAMVKQSELQINDISEHTIDYNFSSGNHLVTWMKTGGPCAGFKFFLREKHEEYAFEKIKEEVDKNQGIKITFKFIRFIGNK